MITSIRRRAATSGGVLVTAVALAVAGLAGFGPAAGATVRAAAGAADANPCKVLKRSEIRKAFAGTVSSGRKDFSTPVTTQCEFFVAANADRPPGTLVVHLRTTHARTTYDALKKQARRYAAVDGVPNALYSDTSHVVQLLKGRTLVGIHAGFTITDPLPIHSFDSEAQLTQLAQLAATRV
jgi:hypothetical protein